MLVEKVLEEEVHKRLQQHVEEIQKTTEATRVYTTTIQTTTPRPITVTRTTTTVTDVQVFNSFRNISDLCLLSAIFGHF